MRKFTRMASKVQNPQKPKQPNLLDQIGKGLLRGLLAGFLFQGTFIVLQFQARIVRGQTSTRLQQIRNMDREVGEKISKGQNPDVPQQFLKDKFKKQVQSLQIDDNKK